MIALDTLRKQNIVIVDGGLGSLLQERGLQGGEKPETWNLTFPERIEKIHLAYLEAGADIITANTFGANRLHYPYNLQSVISSAISIAKAAVAKKGHGLVAMELGPTGKLLAPHGDLAFEDAVSLFHEAAAIGTNAGADLILIETMADSYEMKAAVLGAKEACDLPIIASFTVSENGLTLTGADIEGMAAMLEGLGVYAIGLNCGFGPDVMAPFVKRLLQVSSIPVLLNPNAGLPEIINNRSCYTVSPDDFALAMAPLLEAGLSFVGGCCGTTPKHIAALKQIAQHFSPKPIELKNRTIISSGSCTCVFQKGCAVIGERINPTGKKRLQQALKDNDMDYILSEAVLQMQAGADILDVNVGLPGIDETIWLQRTVSAIQSISPLPLQLDTSDPKALEKALRIYNGKALINSVSGKQSSMDAVFPLMQKYGGVAVALLLDDNGIPDTAVARIAIAKKILNEAKKYGIASKNFIFDGLVMTVSTDPQAATTTLETLRLLSSELNAHTILGVSNVSFGLPQRAQLNAAFLAMAIQNGLSAAIINPLSPAIMSSLRSANALIGADDAFQHYLTCYANAQAAPSVQKSDMSLYDIVLAGLESAAAAKTKELLSSGQMPAAIIETILIPALDEVGIRYETGKSYLPQLLMSASAAKSAFSLLSDAMDQSEQVARTTQKIALATVEGDIHDIGKNIVKVILQNYGFAVIDLGKDVKAETVLQTVQCEKLKLVGLSALMTTTVPAMEKTIALLKKEAPNVKIMVGGAVLTESVSQQIGADCYCKDAIASMKFAKSVFKES